jgi:hypothetical protein
LGARLDEAVQILLENQQSLKKGLESAEFNLRAHQKVLNSLVTDAGPDEVEVEIDGKKEKRINWAVYHKYVEADLAKMAELDLQREKKVHLGQLKILDGGVYAKYKAHILGKADDDEARARAEAFFAGMEDVFQSMRDGKEYDSSRFNTIVEMISEHQGQHPVPGDSTVVFGGEDAEQASDS